MTLHIIDHNDVALTEGQLNVSITHCYHKTELEEFKQTIF